MLYLRLARLVFEIFGGDREIPDLSKQLALSNVCEKTKVEYNIQAAARQVIFNNVGYVK